MGSRSRRKKKLAALKRKNGAERPQDVSAPAERRKIGAAKGTSATGWKKWLFRLVSVVLAPAAVLIAAEVCLRVVGYGYPTSFTIESAAAGGTVCRRNVEFGWRFFPRTISRASEPFSFQARKPPGAYRIFVFGGSAAQGVPDPAYSFSRILQVMLEHRYPGTSFEVINTAITAINSHVVREIAKDCADYQPDLYVVYLGNNEVVGPYGAGTVFSALSPSLSVIRASIGLRSLRIGQMLELPMSALTSRSAPPLTWEGLAMFLERKVRPDSEDLARVYSHFRNNLIDIVDAGREAGAGVVVSTVGSNLKDCPPFASDHRSDLTESELARWDGIYRAGADLESHGRFREALAQYLSAAEIDDRFADLHFRMARCYRETAAFDESKRSFLQARELDTLRFRADARINEIIRSVAAGSPDGRVRLADAQSVLEGTDPNVLPGNEHFYEHVHLRFKGSYLLAKTVLEQLDRILPESVAGGTSPAALLTEPECMERLAFTGWDRYRIAKQLKEDFFLRAPSTSQLYFDARVEEISREIADLARFDQPESLEEARRQYQEAVRLRPSDWKLHAKFGEFLSQRLNEQRAAEDQWRMVLEQVPHHNAYSMLGLSLGMQGRFDEAIGSFDKALEMNPLFDEGHANLGMTLYLKRDMRGAAEHFARAAAINPQSPPKLYIDLARALRDSGRTGEAIEALRRGTTSHPKSADLHCFLGIFLAEDKKTPEAIRALQTALAIDPGHALARKALDRLK